jgi:hypothetical protein
MDPARLLIVAVGVIVSVTVFCLLRFPRFRRAQFREYAPLSFRASTLGAAAVLGLFVLFLLLQR